MVEEDFEGKQFATAQIGGALFQSDSSIARLGSISSGPQSIVSNASLLKSISEQLSLGNEVIIGVTTKWDDGSLAVDFGINMTTGEVMRHDEFAASDHGMLLDFLRSRFPDSDSGPALSQLVLRWNEEQNQPPGNRPISEAWEDFIRDTYGIGLDLPQPGTEEWWNAAPPLCRSLLDAPASVTSKLDAVNVWIHVPSGLVPAKDAVICLRSNLGSMGCSALRPDPNAEYIQFAAFSDGVNPISVQVARETSDGISWVERTDVASVPVELSTGAHAVLVSLDSRLSGSSYDEIASNVGAAHSSVTVMSVAEEMALEDSNA